MKSPLRPRIAGLFLILSMCFAGYAVTSSLGYFDSSYDLTLDNIPVNFTAEKTLYVDTQTNDRGFVVCDTYLLIRSQYLTFYDLNNSYEHEDSNLVIGAYCYATVPAQNATLDTIRPIDRFQLSSWNGTVTVSTSSYTTKRMVLQVNSSDNATLLIRAIGLDWPHRYRIHIDGIAQSNMLTASHAGEIEYNYTGAWSNHTITFSDMGAPVIVPTIYLNIIELFLIIGLFVTVAKVMILPVTSKQNVPPDVVTRNLIHAAIYIAIGLTAIGLVFNLFIGG